MTNSNKNKKSDDSRLAFDHAWKYFELHAKQRVTLFKYFIILISAAAAYVAHSFPSHGVGIIISGIFLVLTYVFQNLDKRNENLVNLSIRAMKDLEKTEFQNLKKLQIFREDSRKKEEYEGYKNLSHSNQYKHIWNFAYLITGLYLLYNVVFYYFH